MITETSRKTADTAGMLVRRLQQHDQEAMADLYDLYGRMLYVLIVRIVHNPSVAEDLVQESFLRAWNRAGQVPSSLRGSWDRYSSSGSGQGLERWSSTFITRGARCLKDSMELAGRRSLPAETQAYVRIVTGYTAEGWAAQQPPQFASSNTPTGARCVEIAKLMIDRARPRLDLTSSPAWGPWGVQLAGNWSEGGVLAAYEWLRRKYGAVLGDRLPLVLNARRGAGATVVVRVSEKSRTDANALCAKLRAAGGACIVLRNPRS